MTRNLPWAASLLALLVSPHLACRTAAPAAPQTNYCSKSPSVVDDAIVIRGGDVNARSLEEGGDVDQAGYMTDLSVNCSGLFPAPNNPANRATYKEGIPNVSYGVTSAKRICQAGGYIATTPYEGHRYHCTVWHLKPAAAASLFTQY